MAYTPYTTRMDRSLPTVLWYAIRVQIKLLALIRIKFHSEHTLSRIKKEKSKHVRKNNTSVHCSWRYDKSRSIRLYNVQAREDARKILLNSRRSKERKREREKKGEGAKDIRRQVALYRGCGKWIIADVKKKKHPLPSSSDRRDTRSKERLETRGISPRFAPRYWPRFISRKDPRSYNSRSRGSARIFSFHFSREFGAESESNTGETEPVEYRIERTNIREKTKRKWLWLLTPRDRNPRGNTTFPRDSRRGNRRRSNRRRDEGIGSRAPRLDWSRVGIHRAACYEKNVEINSVALFRIEIVIVAPIGNGNCIVISPIKISMKNVKTESFWCGARKRGGEGEGYRVNFHDTIIISSNSNSQRGRCIEKKTV